MLEGTITALITPFKAGSAASEVDLDEFSNLIEWQLSEGINGFVVCGTSGESATLSTDEKLSLIQRTVEVVAGRVPVVAGTGSNDTRASLEFTQAAQAKGVDAALVVNPYYNKPSQEGLYQHYKLIAEQGGLPVVMYNIPSRTAVEVSQETFARLAKISNIIAVKQAADSASKLVQVKEAVGDNINILAGDDPLTYFAMTLGGKGVISASANAIPKEMLAITNAGLKGDMAAASKAQVAALPLIRSMFQETNPAPAKAALKIMGKISDASLRLPLVEVSEGTRKNLQELYG